MKKEAVTETAASFILAEIKPVFAVVRFEEAAIGDEKAQL